MELDQISDLPEDEQVYILKQLEADEYRGNLYLLCKNLFGYLDMTWNTHGEMIEVMEDMDVNRRLVVVPRDCFKSSIALQAYAFWRLIREPNLRILIDSELVTNSETYLAAIKGHMVRSEVVDLFGDFKVSDRRWGTNSIVIGQREDRTIKEASITCGGVGTTKVGQHYDLIIGDDYNSDKNSDTPEKRQKVINHVKYNLSILDSKRGEYVFIGTRYAEDDIYGWLLRDVLEMPELADGEMPTGQAG